MCFDASFPMNVSKQNVFALSLIIRIQSSKTQGMALNSSSFCCYVICKFPMFWKQPEFYVFYAHKKNKYCFPFLQSFVCLNGNKRHSGGSKTALSPERREHVVPSHTLCIVHAAKGNQAAPEITLWPLCIDQFLDMPCSVLFQKVWTVSIVCCISLNSIFTCLHKCVLALF